MEFDFTVLKERRKKLKFTQQEVADAIGASQSGDGSLIDNNDGSAII